MSSKEQALHSFDVLTCVAGRADGFLSSVAWDSWHGLNWVKETRDEVVAELGPFVDSFRSLAGSGNNHIAQVVSQVVRAFDSLADLGRNLQEPLDYEQIKDVQEEAENAIQENLVPFFNPPE